MPPTWECPQISNHEFVISVELIAISSELERYINAVESRFTHDEDIYQQFIYEIDQNATSESIFVIQELFGDGNDDLVEDFRRLGPYFINMRGIHELLGIPNDEILPDVLVTIRFICSYGERRQKEHIEAYEMQIGSKLLRLPREIRESIWSEVISDNIVHVTEIASSYQYHSCAATNGLKSSACPAGRGDHALCLSDGPSNFPSYRLICKQINLELPDTRTTFFGNNAFHFSSVEEAAEYIFRLKEPERASIKHLRFPVPYHLCEDVERSSNSRAYDAWEAVTSYYSCPWDRETLGMNVHDEQDHKLLKLPWYFYYSGCYYAHNRHRLYKKWQIGFGGISWDCDIASLKYKGMPKMDIAMDFPARATSIFRQQLNRSIPFSTDFEISPQKWIKPLLQFRQYTGLNFHFWDKNGVKKVDRCEDFIQALKVNMAGSLIGPQIVVEFRGEPLGNLTQWRET